MREASTPYTMVYSPLVFVDFDEHGNVRSHELQWSTEGGLYVNDNKNKKRFILNQLPQEIVEQVDDYLSALDLVRWFQPEPMPDEPF